MGRISRLEERLRGWVERVRALFAPPERKPVGWLVGDEPAPTPKTPNTFADFLSDFKAFWVRARTRLFRVAAGLLALVDLGLGILLYSNVWYLNLMLYAVIVPHILILIHYLRLTRSNVK